MPLEDLALLYRQTEKLLLDRMGELEADFRGGRDSGRDSESVLYRYKLLQNELRETRRIAFYLERYYDSRERGIM